MNKKDKEKQLLFFGICPKTGIIYNPFGQKPQWVIIEAEKLQKKHALNKQEDALF